MIGAEGSPSSPGQPTPSFEVTTDLEHGGRWTHLKDANGKQWLWTRPTHERDLVQPGDAFVDAGGLEECFPTIGPGPDHGDIWTRPWTRLSTSSSAQSSRVSTGPSTLHRTIRSSSSGVVIDYTLESMPGLRFIWAAHALLDLAVGARIIAADGPARAFPDHAEPVETTWPHPLGIDFSALPADDGTAMFCLLPDQAEVSVVDRGDALRMRLVCPGQPVSVGLWRNLGGYPWTGETYRNIGVEPMIGKVFDIHRAGPDDTGTVPASGTVRWRLVIDTPLISGRRP